VLDRALVVTVYIFNSHHHRVSHVASLALSQFRKNDSAVAHVHLRAVVGDPYAESEAERIAEPVDSFSDVGIGKFRNYGAAGYGPVFEHRQ